MTEDVTRAAPPVPADDCDDDGPGNSIVQAAYSAGLFSRQDEDSEPLTEDS